MGKDKGAGCLCDPLALWGQVQWKIVPTANPWHANYSFDPLGVVYHHRLEGGNPLWSPVELDLFWFITLSVNSPRQHMYDQQMTLLWIIKQLIHWHRVHKSWPQLPVNPSLSVLWSTWPQACSILINKQTYMIWFCTFFTAFCSSQDLGWICYTEQ